MTFGNVGKLGFFYLLVCVLFVSACDSASDALQQDAGERIFEYSGPIDAVGADLMVRAFEQGATHLKIRSAGGLIEPSIRVAEAINQRGIAVTAIQYCLSACASHVFVASPRRSVSDGAVLAFHNTVSSGESLRSSVPAYSHWETDAELARRERTLYLARGVDEKLLYYPLYRLHPKCWRFPVTMFGRQTIGLVLEADLVVLSRATLNKLGLHFDGEMAWEPSDISAALSALASAQSLRVKREPLAGREIPSVPLMQAEYASTVECRAS